MSVMRQLKVLTTGAAMLTAAAVTSVAYADGMPGKGKAIYDKPASWSGFYIGGHVGHMWGDIEGNFAPLNTPFQFSADPDAGIAGLHLGIQHQIGAVVFGVEGALSSILAQNDGTTVGGGLAGACGFVAAVQSCEGNIDSIRSIGGRLGFAVDRWLIYGTGGFAQARVSTWGVTNATGVRFSEGSATHNGWYAGGGIEYAVGQNVTFGIDYKHYDFDAEAHTVPIATDSRVVSATSDAITSRLTFKFGRPDPRPLK